MREGYYSVIVIRGKLFSFISTNSLKEILKELDSQLSDEELEGIIEEVDTDGSGTLDFDGKERNIIFYNSTKNLFSLYKTKFQIPSFLSRKTVNMKIICEKNIFMKFILEFVAMMTG